MNRGTNRRTWHRRLFGKEPALALAAWALFTAAFWISAAHKPFHVDEFYSWVYAQNCSFQEILQLKEAGIGHPPLYHLAQKLVQVLTPGHSHYHVRIVNYLAGSLFIVFLVAYLSGYRRYRPFLLSLALSGTLLNLFIFSRMWGLATLFSLLTIICGERYVRKRGAVSLVLLLLCAGGGFASDYSFFIVVPYLLLALFSPLSRIKATILGGMLGLFSLLFLGRLLQKSEEPLSVVCYSFFNSAVKIGSELIILLINPIVQEVLILSSVILLVFAIWNLSGRGERSDAPAVNGFFLVAATCCLLHLLHTSGLVSLVLVTVILALLLLGSGFVVRRRITVPDIDRNRLLVGLVAGVVILMVVSPRFWRDIIQARYINVLMPFLVILLLQSLGRKQLRLLAALIAAGGLIYASSAFVDRAYTAKPVKSELPVVFENVGAYATHYLVEEGDPAADPHLVSMNGFDRYCKLCRMGNRSFPFDEHQAFIYLGSKGVPAEITDLGYEIESSEVWSFTPLDRLLFRYLTPIRGRHFTKYRLRR